MGFPHYIKINFAFLYLLILQIYIQYTKILKYIFIFYFVFDIIDNISCNWKSTKLFVRINMISIGNYAIDDIFSNYCSVVLIAEENEVVKC